MPSFDVVSQVDLQEVDNAVNQTRKEVAQRYDFKDTRTEVTLDKTEIRINSSDEFKVRAAVEVFQGKAAKRQIALKSFVYGAIEPAGGGRAKQTITVQQGIASDKAREIVKAIKDAKLKVQAQIQADQVRVSGKHRDDLQHVIRLLRERDLDLPLQFINFRD
ncbi:MAG: YajQ family cyclic di-GMP-binding protein [Candidatus Binatia bacterium]